MPRGGGWLALVSLSPNAATYYAPPNGACSTGATHSYEKGTACLN